MENKTAIPSHIWAAIFDKITDPKRLLKLQLISKDLKPLVDTALKLADWKRLCENDIGHYALSTVVKSILPKTSFNDFNDITLQSKWMKIYYSYLNWCTCVNNDRPLKQFSTKGLMWNRFFDHDKNTITCLDVWFDYIAAGSTKGTIHVFANFFLIKPYCIIRTGNKKINQVKIWFTASEELLVVSVDVNGYVRFWDVKQKIEKFANTPQITNGLDLYINTSRNLYVVKRRQVLRLQLLPTCKNELKLSQCDFDWAQEDSQILTLNFFEPHKISLLTRVELGLTSTFYLYSNIYDEPEGLNMSNVQQEVIPYMYIDRYARWPFFSFNNKALMYFHRDRSKGKDCLVILHHFDYWSALSMKYLFGGNVTCLAWHGHYFIVGLIYGEIRIFYIENLDRLDGPVIPQGIDVLDNTQVRTIKLESKPVIDIKISRILDTPVIIAATENHIHQITLEK